MPIKVWVPSKDGVFWSSNRTRDVLDLSFIVYKHKDGEPCRVEIRQTYPGGQRAKHVVGKLAFPDHKTAKVAIEHHVLEAYTNFAPVNQEAARAEFLNKMLVLSMDSVPIGPGSSLQAYVSYGEKTHRKASLSAPVVEEEVEEERINIFGEILNAFNYDAAIGVMLEHIEEVEEVAKAAIEPEAPKTITVGDQTINLGWPS